MHRGDAVNGRKCMGISEKQLVRKARAGDQSAFGRLVTAYRDPILFLIYDYVGDYEDARDLAQDVFIKAFQKLDQFEGRSKFSTWIYRIAVNQALDFRRRNKRVVLRDFEDPANSQQLYSEDQVSESVEKSVEQAEFRQQIERCLENVSDQQRTALVLKYFHQKSTDEIAEIMECSAATVRTHLFRALQHLRKMIGPGKK